MRGFGGTDKRNLIGCGRMGFYFRRTLDADFPTMLPEIECLCTGTFHSFLASKNINVCCDERKA
jgi:hypothetical protein